MKIFANLGRLLATISAALMLPAPAYATLQARDLDGDEVTDAFYDTDLNIPGCVMPRSMRLWTGTSRWHGRTAKASVFTMIGAWLFDASFGTQFNLWKGKHIYAMAVRPGDVRDSTVPEPESLVLSLTDRGGLRLLQQRLHPNLSLLPTSV